MQRVSQKHPCPICGRPDWCLFEGEPGNPTAVICARIESEKRCGEAGWLHKLRDDDTWRPRVRPAPKPSRPASNIDFGKLAASFRQAVKPSVLGGLARNLGLTVDSLNRLGIGWSQEKRSWTFPMTNTVGKVLGIRLRCPDGKKLSIRGGREGLFVPKGIDAGGLLLIAEGPTDTAALLDPGFNAVGRPNCTGGVKLLIGFCHRGQPTKIVVVADSDGPGRHGADSLAKQLNLRRFSVCVIAPPPDIKDAREWKQRGATRKDIKSAITQAERESYEKKTKASARRAAARVADK